MHFLGTIVVVEIPYFSLSLSLSLVLFSVRGGKG